jgi:hypothetical protein
MCVLIFPSNIFWNISHPKNNWATYDRMCIGLHVNYLLCLLISKKLEFSRQIFEKYSNIKFHENPSRGEPRCSIWTDRQIRKHDNFFNTLKNCEFFPNCIYVFFIFRTHSDFCPIQHKLIGFYNWDEKWLLRGTDWVSE